jgi:autotransporter-associated beta strand protein
MSIRLATHRFDRATSKKSHRAALIAAAVACAPALLNLRSAQAANGTWTNTTSGGLWSASGSWTGGTVANGVDATADFSTLALTGSNTVHLDSARTIGTVNFGDTGNQYGWTLDNNGSLSNVLTLQTSSGTPSINVVNQTATISAPIAGTQGFNKTGAGNLLLTGASTYSGVTNISNGTLILGAAASTAAPAAGAVLDIDPTQSTITTTSGKVTGITDLANSGDSVTASGLGGPTVGSINGHKALSFSSSGLITSFTSGTNPATVFAVVNPTDVTDGGIIGSNSTDGALFRIVSGKLDLVKNGIADSQNHSVGSVPTNTPTVVALSFNSSSGTYYINGTSQGSTGSAALSLGGSNKLTIGYQYSYGGYNDEFKGNIGTILVYNSVLSPADMATTLNFLQQEYAAPSSVTGTSLVNLANAAGSLSIANSTQAISSLSGVANSNVYLGGGTLTVGSDNTSTTFAGNLSDTGPGTTATGGTLVKTGTGTLTLGGAVGNTGGLQVNAGGVVISGTYNSSGPTSVTAGTLSITGTDTSTGATTLTGGTLSITGTQSTTGSFTINSGATLSLAGNSTATGAITVNNGGTLQLVANAGNINTSNATSSAIGSPSAITYADNTHTTNIQLRGDSSVTFANSCPTAGTGGYNSGTTINFDVNNLGGSSTATGQTLAIGNTTPTLANPSGIAGFAAYKTTINVTGGNNYTLSLPSINEDYGTALTLNANTANLAITGGIADAGVITVSGAMNTSLGAITGASGALSKVGSGRMTLTGSNTYPGTTTIAGGSVVLGPSGSFSSTSAISIASAASFNVSANSAFALPLSSTILSGTGTIVGPYTHSLGILSPGGNGTVGTLNITNGLNLSGGSLFIDLSGSNNSTGGIYNDLISVTGPLTLAGSTTINLGPVTPTVASGTTYTIVTATGGLNLGTGTLSVASSAFSVLTTSNAIELKYNSGVVGADVWTGSSSSTWDSSTSNFVPLGSTSPISFSNGDNVTFNDSSSVTSVTLNSTLSPASVTVSSNTSNYSFSGSGSINGSGGLLKTGSSTLTISTANTYTGTTNIAGGTVIVNNTSGVGLGTGPMIIGAGATVQVGDGGNNGAIANGNTDTNTITDNGVLAFNSSSTTLNPPVLITGTGSLFINASLGIGHHNTYSGGTTIAGGNVIAYEGDTFGTGLVTVNGGQVQVQFGDTFANNFNLSGNALINLDYGSGLNTEIDGLVTLTGPTTVTVNNGSAIKFMNPATALAGNNQSLTVAGDNNGGSFLLGGSTNLGTGTITVNNGVGLQFVPPASTTITIPNTIAAASYVIQNGPGTTVLSGSNTYTGSTEVSNGILEVTNSLALNSSSVVTVDGGNPLAVSTAYLGLSGGVTLSVPFTLGGRAGTSAAAPEIVNMSGNNVLTGTIGTTTGGNNYIIESDAGNLTLSGNFTPAGPTGARNLDLQGAATGTWSGNIQDGTSTIALNVTGGGTWTLSGTNTYSGGTNVSNGTLILSTTAALPANSNLSIGSVGTATPAMAQLTAGTSAGLLTLNQLVVSGTTNAWNGKLDLTNNALIVHNGTLGDINNLAAAGYAGGTWNGTTGIVSSTAAADTTHLTAIGVALGTAGNTFEGATVSTGDVLVKYTYYGDALLTGSVTTADYTQIDAGFLSQGGSTPLTGWQNGDFNYDGTINGSDYTLIDNAFNQQGAQLLSQVASATAQIAVGGTASAVPEPSVLGLIGFGVAGVLGRRRRR